jgi:hypothetical protein
MAFLPDSLMIGLRFNPSEPGTSAANNSQRSTAEMTRIANLTLASSQQVAQERTVVDSQKRRALLESGEKIEQYMFGSQDKVVSAKGSRAQKGNLLKSVDEAA